MAKASKLQISTKRLAIGKAQTEMMVTVAVAAFITIFCLVASSSLWSQRGYQNRVIARADAANKQLKANVTAVQALVSSYKDFVNQPLNIIGGSSTGSGDNDGDNAKIVLDALPSQYDFPALTSTIEKILKDRNFDLTSITGTDDEVAQSAQVSSPTPKTVTMPFSFTVNHANYPAVQSLISVLEASIRPIQIDSLELSGGVSDMQVTINAHTYYQPAKNLQITKEVVK